MARTTLLKTKLNEDFIINHFIVVYTDNTVVGVA